MAGPSGFRVAARQGVSYAFMIGINNFTMKFQEIIDYYAKLNKEQEALMESRQPEIGTFYIVDRELLKDAEFPRYVHEIDAGAKRYGKAHFRFWYETAIRMSESARQVMNEIDDDRKISWKYYPRGRVICNENNMDFHVICDEHILKVDIFKNVVLKGMNLPSDTKFFVDKGQYKCYYCAPQDFTQSHRG